MFKTVSSLLLATSLASPAFAQNFFGKWADPNGPMPNLEFFVSTTGTPGGAGTLAQPFRTITEALAVAEMLQLGNANFRITINVFPGTYLGTGPNPETLPLKLPAFGVSLETYNPTPGAAPDDRAVVSGAGAFPSSIIQVDRVSFNPQPVPPTLPETVIHGFEIVDANRGIRIEPSLTGQLPPDRPIAVEVRRCWIQRTTIGVDLVNDASWTAFNQLDDNEIGIRAGRVTGIGVRETCSGFSSTMLRSNRIHNFEDNVRIVGNGAADSCRPRLLSNFIQLGERNVTLTNCDPFVVNNTIAFAINYTNVTTVEGLTWSGGFMTLANNLLWNPQVGSGAAFAVDLTTFGVVIGATNRNEDLPGVPPLMIGGDGHPAANIVRDLHLNLNSLLINAGTSGFVADLADPVTPDLTVFLGGNPVRVDVACDVDRDPRIMRLAQTAPLNPEIGGDEVTLAGLTPQLLGGPGGIDENGNTVGMLAGGSLLALNVTGVPGRAYAVFLGSGFFQDPVFQSSLNPWGIANLDLTGANTLVLASGVIPASGVATVNFTMPTFAMMWEEAEMYLQAFVADVPTGDGQLTRRMRLELNQ